MTKELTAERLREVLHYDPETGVFTWKVKTGRRAVVGVEAGHPSPVLKYRILVVDRHQIQAHRAAFLYMTGCFPIAVVDHINGVHLDNRWTNLREVTPKKNRQNIRKAPKNSRSGVLGAQMKRGKWDSAIVTDGKRKWLGSFDTPEQANAAYVAAKRVLHEGCTI